MSKSKALGTLKPMKTTTAVKAWTMKCDGKTYQVCEYDSRMTGPSTSIWECNGTGSKRLSDELRYRKGMDHFAAASEFLDTIILISDEEDSE
jgi:hypothetical protein